MKSKMCLIVTVGIILIGLFSQILIQTCTAESAKLSITSTTYKVSKTTVIGGRAYVFYNISIVMHNAGAEISQNTTLYFIDDEGIPAYRENMFAPGEYKEFTFNEWPLTGTGEHQINISYYPTDQNVLATGDNSGISTFNVSSDGSTPSQKSTPGFEIIVLLSAIVLISLIKRKRRK
ncbi:MAG: hypothetical protein NT038_06705 [Euryarchaeota archaeon]|nr:hypothetical protein [Euryarchaeota archaeon]